MAFHSDHANLISKSDENIRNAYTQILDFKKKSFQENPTLHMNNTITVDLKTLAVSSVDSAFVSDDGSLFENTDGATSLKTTQANNCLEFDHNLVEVFRNLFIARKMIDSFVETKEELQASVERKHEEDIQSSEDVISTAKLKEISTKMDRVYQHVNQITGKVGRLKSVLRSTDKKDHLKIHVQYHRHVVDFFSALKLIFTEIEKDLAELQICKSSKFREDAYVEFSTKVEKLTTELHKSVDTVNEFRTHFDALVANGNNLLDLSS